MAEKTNAPEIRFAGFTDPWEQRKFILDDVSSFITKGATPTTYGFEWVDSGIPFFRNDSIKDNIFVYGDFSYISEEAHAVLSRSEIHARDILISITGDIGKVAIIPDEVLRGNINQHTARIRVVGKYDPYFVYTFLRTEAVQEGFKAIKTGLSMPQLSLEQIRAIELPGVASDEQRLLGRFFLQLDNLITLHQRKHDKLVQLKKSMLDKMFPKPGETEPEIRFAGFTDPWEQRKFADFVTASGIRNSENLELPSYSVTNDRGFVPQDEQFENGGTMREADKTSYWIVEPKSFAYNPARINVGSIGYQSTSGNVIVSSLYEVFQTDETCDDRFLWHWFKTRLFTQQIEMLQEGGVRLYFFFDKLLKSGIGMPSVDEQRLIGNQFDWLDNLITLHQRKLELLRNTKKSLLDRMFV